MKLKINVDLPGYKAGTTVTVKTDAQGIPLERFWRDRIHDADYDNCVEIVKKESKPKAQKESPKEESK